MNTPLLTAAILSCLISTSCQQPAELLKNNVTVYGDRGIVTLNDNRLVAGELVLIQLDSLWVSSVTGSLVSIPFNTINNVEIIDTEINAYLAPTLVASLGPWTAIALSGLKYTDGESIVLVLVGGLFAVVPIVANEAGMSSPDFDINEISGGALSQYLRIPFVAVSENLRKQILEQHHQHAPLRVDVVDSLKWVPRAGE